MLTALALAATLISDPAPALDVNAIRCAQLRSDAAAGSMSRSAFGGGLMASGLVLALSTIYDVAKASGTSNPDLSPSAYRGVVSLLAMASGAAVIIWNNRGYTENALAECDQLIADEEKRLELLRKGTPHT